MCIYWQFRVKALSDSENVFINIVKNHLPIGITGIAIAAMISIILSTLSSLLNSAVVTLNEDILKFKVSFGQINTGAKWFAVQRYYNWDSINILCNKVA